MMLQVNQIIETVETIYYVQYSKKSQIQLEKKTNNETASFKQKLLSEPNKVERNNYIN